MNNNFRNLFIITVILITAIIAYSVGIYAKNVIVVSNSEIENSAEISEDIPIENLNEDFEIENEIPISDIDLTTDNDYAIIILRWE